MRINLLRSVDRLDRDLEDLLKKLNTFDDITLNQKPAPDVWSPMQILLHLHLSEKLSLAYVQKKLSFDPEVNGAGLFNQLKSMALRLALWSPIRFAAARGVGNDVLPARGSFEQVSEDWLAQRAILRTYMEGLDAKWMDKVVYKHPYVGKLSLGQMLDFFNAHFHRHQHQILERLPQS